MREHRNTTRRARVAPRTLTIVGGLAVAVLLLAFARSGFLPGDNGPEASEASGDVTTTSACTEGRSFYVSPEGTAEALGTLEQPLDLHTALSAASPAKPCDTIWLRGGTYSGAYATAVSGSEGAPVTIRRYEDERAVLDSSPTQDPALALNSSHLRVWGLEITSSNPQRTSGEAVAWPGDLPRGTGVATGGTGNKLINLIIHDLARGIQVKDDAVAPEFYGNLIYYNGWDGPQRANGNGIETQGRGNHQLIADNVIFNQFSHGVIALGSATAPVTNLTMEGNVVFNSGLPGRDGVTRDILVGGATPAANLLLRDNATYGGAQTYLGQGRGCKNARVLGNYLVGSSALIIENCAATITGNTFYSQYGFGNLPRTYADNTYQGERPKGVVVRERPNKYEAGRAHIVVYNWDKQESVAIDLSRTGLKPGDQYEIRDAQNYFAGPIVTQTFTDGKVNLPMTGLSTAPLVGRAAPIPHTGPEFGAFVVQKVPAPAAPR